MRYPTWEERRVDELLTVMRALGIEATRRVRYRITPAERLDERGEGQR